MPKTINTAIESVPLNLLKPHPRNVNQGDFGAIQQSVETNGFYGTIVANKRTGHILAGNHRYAVAKAMNYTDVPVAWVDVDDEQELRILIADNRTTRLGIDNEASLTELLAELAATPTGLTGTGFDGDDLDALISSVTGADKAELLTDPDEVPEDAPTRCNPGDLWQLGDHRLLCGDSTKSEDVERLMAGEKANACVTDPPYGIGVDSAMHKQSGTKYGKAAAAKRHYAATDWDKLPPKSVIDNASAFRESIIFGGNYFFLPPARCWLVWDKENGDNAFADCELAWTNLDQPVRIKRHMWNGMIRKDKEERSIHPTQKPVGVMAWCVGMTAGLVYDPFLGSGTTLIAAEQLGRTCYGMEISPKYCDVIIERWERATGKIAVLLEAGNGTTD